LPKEENGKKMKRLRSVRRLSRNVNDVVAVLTHLRPSFGARSLSASTALTNLSSRDNALHNTPGSTMFNGKLADKLDAVFNAMLARKGLAVGFYDGTILPIDLVDVDPKLFTACVEYSLRVWENAQHFPAQR
jgi:hypothetical protein